MRTRYPAVRTTALGLGVAVTLFALLLYLVGPGAVLGALAATNHAVLPLVLVTAVTWMTAWSRSMYLVLRRLDVPVTVSRSFLVYSAVMFLNTVAPFSALGAEPLAALLVSRSTDQSYERGFAAVASVDVINYLPAPGLAVVGLSYFAVTASLGRTADVVTVSLVGLLVLLLSVGTLAWRRRRRLAEAVPPVAARVDRQVGAYLPRSLRSEPLALERRSDAAVDALERIAADRRTLALGLVTSTLGWTLFASMLWLSLYAVGTAVPVVVPLFVVPLAMVTNFVPLPGGVGSVDAALVLLLVVTTGVPAATATAAVVIHRSASVFLPVVVGGTSIALLWRT